ncbi:dicarboxylate/amino acid:cation symporter [Georgenia sp. TF02-10]|uniref:dicarboxylate/amino acid:cation symporter n=1 Tax=Georgenia sp. TF02-10 TaxID=2917725 RepID=UPI001FA72239|nr:dicarboxylate/amino acid:cation symporter [Georgenia sp. TF02-10]UNX55515.1 dicarboxylate/amino acid:cation symporter [Georgenia sp. TF02-10]
MHPSCADRGSAAQACDWERSRGRASLVLKEPTPARVTDGEVVMRRVLGNYRFSIILLFGVVVGAVLGLTLGERAIVLKPVADVFLNLVFCLIVPVVITSISSSIAAMGNLGKLRKILLLFLAVIVVTGLMTALLALLTALIFKPAQGAVLDLEQDTSGITGNLDLVGLFTTDDFVNLLSIDNMMPMIVFSVLLGISAALVGQAAEPLSKLLASATEVLSKMVAIVMYIAPIGIAAYFASLVGTMGGQVISSIARLSVMYVLFCVVFFVLFGVAFSYAGGGREGVRRYFKNVWLPAATGMGTCSSTASIPANRIACEQMGIPRVISDLVVPLGASMHKNGVVSVQMFKIIFLLGVFDRPIDVPTVLTAVFVAVISGIIVGTIPSGGFIGELFIVTAFGFPTEVVPIIVIMGTLTDPFCTMNNVAGDSAAAMFIARVVEGKDWIKRTVGTGDRPTDDGPAAAVGEELAEVTEDGRHVAAARLNGLADARTEAAR